MIVFLKSIIIGMFAVFPGISGSALAISLNIYDKFFCSLKNIRKNYLFILYVLIGIIIGILLGSKLIICLSSVKNLLYYIFIGLTIGSIPFIIKKTKKIKYTPLFLSFILSTITLFFCKRIFSSDTSFIKMIFGGLFFSFGKIFPGVSSSFFLIILGIYDKILILFSNPLIIIKDLEYYFPFIIGFLIGLLIFIRLLNYLMLYKYDLLYSILIGFIFSSIINILPKIEYNLINLIGIPLMFISIAFSFKLNKKWL